MTEKTQKKNASDHLEETAIKRKNCTHKKMRKTVAAMSAVKWLRNKSGGGWKKSQRKRLEESNKEFIHKHAAH